MFNFQNTFYQYTRLKLISFGHHHHWCSYVGKTLLFGMYIFETTQKNVISYTVAGNHIIFPLLLEWVPDYLPI